MSTYDQLVNNVISDMAKDGESGITAAASNAVDLAIKHYENQQWWFLESRTVITSSSSAEYYTHGYQDIDSITIEINSNTYPLIQRTYETIEGWFTKSNVYVGFPTDFAMYGAEIRLYPIPNDAYNMTVSGRKSIGSPSAAGSNAWTTDAELLIQSRAEWQLYSLRYGDLEGAAAAKQVENDELSRLRSLNMSKTSTGRARRRR